MKNKYFDTTKLKLAMKISLWQRIKLFFAKKNCAVDYGYQSGAWIAYKKIGDKIFIIEEGIDFGSMPVLKTEDKDTTSCYLIYTCLGWCLANTFLFINAY